MNQFGLCTEQELATLHAWTNEPNGATPVFVEGDCRERMAELPANCIHMIVTSPPYPDGHRKPADWGRYRGEQFQEIHKAQMRGDDAALERMLKNRHAPGARADIKMELGELPAAEEPVNITLQRLKKTRNAPSSRMKIQKHLQKAIDHPNGPCSQKERAAVEQAEERFLHGQPNAVGARGLAVHLHPDNWLSWFESFLPEIHRVLKPNRAFLLNVGGVSFPQWHQHGFIYQIPALVESHGFSLVREIIWYKTNGKPVSADHVMAEKTEKIWWFQKGAPGDRPVWFPWELSKYGPDRVKVPVVSNVWEIAVGRTRWPKGQTHFACYPEELATRAIKGFSVPGELVLDPFGGSGTTAIAARKLSRQWMAMELNPAGEIECAKSRWEMEFGDAARA